MKRESSKGAVVRRLQFALAELEVISGIADSEEEPALLEQLQALAQRVRQCIGSVLNGSLGQNKT